MQRALFAVTADGSASLAHLKVHGRAALLRDDGVQHDARSLRAKLGHQRRIAVDTHAAPTQVALQGARVGEVHRLVCCQVHKVAAALHPEELRDSLILPRLRVPQPRRVERDEACPAAVHVSDLVAL